MLARCCVDDAKGSTPGRRATSPSGSATSRSPADGGCDAYATDHRGSRVEHSNSTRRGTPEPPSQPVGDICGDQVVADGRIEGTVHEADFTA